MKSEFYKFVLTAAVFLLSLDTCLAQWDGWDWQREVTISNGSGSALTDFQVKIDLSSLTPSFDFSHAKGDGSDLRITDADEETEIPFWIEKWDSTAQEAIIWVKVPSIPVSGSTIYLYYGNTLASTMSNGTATFEFFDDFSTHDTSGENWIRLLSWTGSDWSGYTSHDWKYSMIMQEGALYYSIRRADSSWTTESLDNEIESEFDYMHSQTNTNGTVNGMAAEPQYC